MSVLLLNFRGCTSGCTCVNIEEEVAVVLDTVKSAAFWCHLDGTREANST